MFPRFAHIEKNGEAEYLVHDANRYGNEESGFTQPSASLSRMEVANWLASEGVPSGEIGDLMLKVDREGAASVLLKPRRSRLVRAWFDTVINPLIGSLETELELAAKGNWTWRFRPPGLEWIRPAARHLEPIAAASLEQISRLASEVSGAIRSHDASVKDVLTAANQLHNAVRGAQVFTRLCESLLDPKRLADTGIPDVQEIFGAYWPEYTYDLIAQYIVNNTRDLPDYYGTAKFWNRNRQAIYGVLGQDEIPQYHKALLDAGARLRSATELLLQRLKDLRFRLSLEHDVPIALGVHDPS